MAQMTRQKISFVKVRLLGGPIVGTADRRGKQAWGAIAFTNARPIAPGAEAKVYDLEPLGTFRNLRNAKAALRKHTAKIIAAKVALEHSRRR